MTEIKNVEGGVEEKRRLVKLGKNGKAGKNTAKKKKMQKDGRNLVILGLGAVLVAVTTTGVSLIIYHNSGDIYLDRSRPGFLPDEEEVEKEEVEEEEEYDLKNSGPISKEVLDEYIDKIGVEVKAIEAYGAPFDGKILSDVELGIPEGE